jgi:hypothetical protein
MYCSVEELDGSVAKQKLIAARWEGIKGALCTWHQALRFHKHIRSDITTYSVLDI